MHVCMYECMRVCMRACVIRATSRYWSGPRREFGQVDRKTFRRAADAESTHAQPQMYTQAHMHKQLRMHTHPPTSKSPKHSSVQGWGPLSTDNISQPSVQARTSRSVKQSSILGVVQGLCGTTPAYNPRISSTSPTNL